MFVHLRCRSRYSFGLGTLKPSDIASLASDSGMPAVAMVDRNLFGAESFAKACLELGPGLKAIHGLEIMLIQGDQARPLTLLAMSTPAYRRLEELASRYDRNGHGAHVEIKDLGVIGFGLIGICGGPDGWIRQLVGHGRWDEARGLIRQLQDALQGRFFLETLPFPPKDHSFRPHSEVLHQILGGPNPTSLSPEGLHYALARLAKETGVLQVVAPLIAHPERFSINIPTAEGSAKDLAGHHWLSEEGMRDCFGGWEQTSLGIADGIDRIDLGRRHFLSAPTPKEQTAFMDRCRTGLWERLARHPADGPRYLERLHTEIRWLTESSNAGHWVHSLMATADLAKEFRSAGLPIGPGFGEFTSSLMAWALGIHETDPIALGLSCTDCFNPAANPSTRPFPMVHVGLRTANMPLLEFARMRPSLSVPAAMDWQPFTPRPKTPAHFGPLGAHPILLAETGLSDLASIRTHLVLTEESESFPTWNPEGWSSPIKAAQWLINDPPHIGFETIVLVHDPALDTLHSLREKAKQSGLDPLCLDLTDPKVIRDLAGLSIPGFLELSSDEGSKTRKGADIWSLMCPSSFEEVINFFAMWDLRRDPKLLERYLEAKCSEAVSFAQWATPMLASTFGLILFDQQLEALAEQVGLSVLQWNGIMMRFHRAEIGWGQVTKELLDHMRGSKDIGLKQTDAFLAAIIAPGTMLQSRAHCMARALLLWQIVSLKARLSTLAGAPLPQK